MLLAPADKPLDPPTVVMIGDYDVKRLEWCTDDRLLIWIDVHWELDGKPTGYRVGDWFIKAPLNRILSINLDGSESAILFGGQKRLSRQEFDLSTIIDKLPGDPNHILMQAWDSLKDCYVLYKVDVRTGEAAFFERGTQATYGWFSQNGAPVVRFDSNRSGTITSLFTRAPGASDWKLYRKLRRNELLKFGELDIVGVTPDEGVLLVATQQPNDAARVIRRFDLRTLELGEVIAAQPGRDIDAVFVDEQARLVATAFTDDRLDYTFFDPNWKTHYRSLAKFFKNDANLRLVDISLDHNRAVLSVTSPTQPGSWWVYDKAVGSLTPLGDSQPWLKDRLAPMKVLKVKSRDGLDLAAYLTTPLGPAGPRPLVIYPHGGPELRDSYDYDSFVQAFAAKGWMVLQVNFRGSSGYGQAFADAGRKHWGVEMQNDIEDALAAVVATGEVDVGRVAICGTSYGGYAALMGAIKTPLAYKAIVSIEGVSDLIDMLAFSRREDGEDSPVYAYWRKTIGDPVEDRAQIEAASPARRAKEFQAPVLLIHGNLDSIVPTDQSRQMSKALKAANRPVKYVELRWVGHRGWDRETRQTIISETLDHIGKAFATPA